PGPPPGEGAGAAVPAAGASGPAPAAAAQALVAPSSPDALRAQVPQTMPSAEDVAADMDDPRSLDDKRAEAQQHAAGVRVAAAEYQATAGAELGTHKQSVRQHVVGQSAAVRAARATHASGILQQATAARAQLTASAAQEKDALRAQVEADVAATTAATAQKVASARSGVASRRQALTAAADAERSGSLAFADGETARAVGQLEADAAACEQAGEAEAARFSGEEEPAPEQRQAARQVGRESAADIRAKKPDVPRELRAQAQAHAQRCTEYAQDVLARLSETEQTLVAELQTAGTEATNAVRDGLTGALAAIDARCAQDLAAVAAAQSAAVAHLDTASGQALTELMTGGAGAERELDTVEAAVEADLEHGAEEAATVMAEPERPFLPGVREQDQAARAGMASTVAGMRTQVAASVDGSLGRFTAVATGFSDAGAGLVQDVAGRLAVVRDGFATAAAQVRATRSESAAAVRAGLEQRQQGVTDAVLAQADDAVAQVRGKLAEMAGEYRAGIRQAADRSVAEAARPRTDDVSTRAREAGTQVDDGWLAGLGRAIVQIAIGLVVLVVVALIVAAIAAAFSVVLTAWAAVMIAGAILLAVSLVVSLVTRFRQQELQGRPGLAIVLALSDTIGVTGIIEGIRGKELVTNRELSAGEQTERGVLGAVTFVGLILGARSALKGPPGGTIFRPIELPAGLFARMATGVASVAAEMASGLGRSARAVRDWLTGKSEAPRGCFVPGTPVRGQDGPVPIEQLVVGDKVVAQDPTTGLLTTEVVIATAVRTVPRVLDVRTGGEVVTCSPEHPFWVEGTGWCPAGALVPGDLLRTADGRTQAVDAVSARPGTGWTVHNVTVRGAHTYHVGSSAVLVHNKAIEADFVPRQRALVGEVEAHARRASDATQRAQALPEDAAGRAELIREAESLGKEARQLQGEANRASSIEDVAELEDWHAGAKARLAQLEQRLPAAPEPVPVEPQTHEFTAEGAMNELRQEGHWTTLNRDHPGRTWTGNLAEKMPSSEPTQTKQKLVVTGTKTGEAPVSYDFSVVYDHETGRFTYIGRSGGKPKSL
ncbi:hypothetical protein HP550_11120, partial [Cellulomonas humilata]